MPWISALAQFPTPASATLIVPIYDTSPDPLQSHLFHQLLLHTLSNPDPEHLHRSQEILMTEQPAQLLRRKQQPLRPLDQPEKIARLNLPRLKNLILSKLVDPVGQDKGRLQLRQELVISDRILKLVSHLAHELVTVTRRQHSQLVKLAPTRTRPWSNIRRLRDEV